MKTLSLLLILLAGSASPVLAQQTPSGSGQAMESDSASTGEVEQIESIFQDNQRDDALPVNAEKLNVPVESLSQVRRLEPFKDIAVIQRRYLPKTHRFELYGSGGLIMNDAFFNNLAFGLRFAYNFSEAYGVELIGMSVSTDQKEITKDLKSEHFVTTETLVSPTNYYGAAFKWTPFFGKMTWLNKSIVPFDHYFEIGGGSTSTNQGSTAPTIHVGTGQVYARSKRFAFRWDLSWMLYNTTSGVQGSTGDANYNNLYLGLGMSWFFPEATYR